MTHKGWRVVKPQHNQSYRGNKFYFPIWSHKRNKRKQSSDLMRQHDSLFLYAHTETITKLDENAVTPLTIKHLLHEF